MSKTNPRSVRRGYFIHDNVDFASHRKTSKLLVYDSQILMAGAARLDMDKSDEYLAAKDCMQTSVRLGLAFLDQTHTKSTEAFRDSDNTCRRIESNECTGVAFLRAKQTRL